MSQKLVIMSHVLRRSEERCSVHHNEIIIDHHFQGLNPMQFGHEDCKPSHDYGPAVRTHWLLHYVVSGFGKFTREGVTYDIGPGQIFVIPPYLETYYQADDKRPWKYIWIGFTAKEVPEVFLEPVITCPNAGSVFHEMMSCGKMKNGRSAFLSSCLWKLVSVLLEHDEVRQDYVDEALNFMHSDYANGITIQKIADSLGLNRKYFCSIFSKRVGVSPSEYLIQLRLNRAAELMTVYYESPTTAAMSVGYDDLYHFSKIFKKYFGVSPRNYCRMQIQKNQSK